LNITDYIVDKLNAEEGVQFRSNYVLDFVQTTTGAQFTLFNVNRHEIEMDTIEFVPVSEVVNQNTPFVEKNKRDGWIKTFAFPLKIKNGFQFDEDDLDYQALISLREGMNGSVDTISGKKVSFKVTYPRYDQKALSGGDWYAVMVMDFYMTTISQGFFCNEFSVNIKRTADATYHELDFIEFSLPTGADSITVSDVRTNNNSVTRQARYTTQFSLSFNYFGGALENELYEYQMGKGNPRTEYDLRLIHESGTYDYTVSVTAGTPLWKLGTVDRISIDLKEV